MAVCLNRWVTHIYKFLKTYSYTDIDIDIVHSNNFANMHLHILKDELALASNHVCTTLFKYPLQKEHRNMNDFIDLIDLYCCLIRLSDE